MQIPVVILASAAEVTIALVVLAIGWLALTKVHDRIYNAGVAAEREWAQNRLRTAAWWFSEDEPTMRLLMDLANANLQEWQAREEWRKRRWGGSRG